MMRHKWKGAIWLAVYRLIASVRTRCDLNQQFLLAIHCDNALRERVRDDERRRVRYERNRAAAVHLRPDGGPMQTTSDHA